MVSQPDETKEKDKGKNQESDKKKRDWIDLLAIPIVLALVGAGLSWLNNAFQQKLADNKQRDAVVTQYIQNMKELLLDKDRPLRESKENDVSRDVARIFTTTTLQQLTSDEDKNGKNKQKASVLLFLSLSNFRSANIQNFNNFDGKVRLLCLALLSSAVIWISQEPTLKRATLRKPTSVMSTSVTPISLVLI